jgi:hypothetical protein
MAGKPITLSRSEYDVLRQAKKAYELSSGESADWGQFLLFLLGLYIMDNIGKSANRHTNGKIRNHTFQD